MVFAKLTSLERAEREREKDKSNLSVVNFEVVDDGKKY